MSKSSLNPSTTPRTASGKIKDIAAVKVNINNAAVTKIL